MIKWFLFGAILALVLNLVSSVKPQSKECDGDCYTCEWYDNGCQGNEADYLFYEEEDEI